MNHVIILLVVIFVLGRGRETGDTPMVCQTGRGGTPYKLPPLLNCTETKYASMTVDLYKRNVKEYESEIKGVTVIRRTCTTRTGFLGDKTAEKSMTREILPAAVVNALFRQGSCVNPEGKVMLTSGTNNYRCQYGWMKTVTTHVMECKHYEGKLFKRHGEAARTDLGPFHDCKYDKGSCRTQSGMYLRWKPDAVVQEAFMKKGRYAAVKAGNHILVPSLGLVIDAPAPEGPWETSIFKVVPIQIEASPNDTLSVAQTGDSVEALREELNARIEYLAEVIKSPRAKLEYLCSVMNDVRREERVAAYSAPRLYAQMKFGQTDITAIAAGEYLVVYPCKRVAEWRWDDKKPTCEGRIPILYKMRKEDKMEDGLLIGGTNEVLREKGETKCIGKKTAALVGGNLTLHQGVKRHEINVSGAQVLDNVKDGIPFADFLDTDWVYEDDELDSANVDRQDMTDRDGDPEEQSGVHWVWKVMGVSHVGWDALVDGAWACFTRLVCLGVVISEVTQRLNLRWRLYAWIAENRQRLRGNSWPGGKWEEDATSEWTDAAEGR